jgi:putative toxin-antitoxin system antitoxin component (TIGR02293 family)
MGVRLRCEALWARAVEIFGSETKADRWFHTRLSELADRTPEEVLEKDSQTEAVGAVLDRIEYGVFN